MSRGGRVKGRRSGADCVQLTFAEICLIYLFFLACLRASMIASRWVDEMRERVREKKSTRRQNNYSGGKKQYKTKQNKVRLGGKQTAVAAEGRNRSWKSSSRIKKRRKKIVEKKILIRRRGSRPRRPIRTSSRRQSGPGKCKFATLSN